MCRSRRSSPRHDRIVSDTFSCNHFALSNPADDGADDLPRLLRQIADEIERRAIAPMELLDLTVSQESPPVDRGGW
jgi:hypothetical protein